MNNVIGKLNKKVDLILEYIVNKENTNDLKNKYERDYYKRLMMESEKNITYNNIPVELLKPYDGDYINALTNFYTILNKIKKELNNSN